MRKIIRFLIPFFLFFISCDDGSADETKADDLSSWVLVTSNASWSPRAGMAGVVFKNKMWITGGFEISDGETKALNDVWSSEDGETWTKAVSSAPWSPRAGHCMLVFKNKIWIIAGNADTDYFNDVWSSEDGINWTNQKPSDENEPWGSRTGISCFTSGNKMLVAGGADYNGLNEIWSSEDGKTWIKEISAPWNGRAYSAYTEHEGNMWIIGGNEYAKNFYKDVWMSKDGGKNWDLLGEIEVDSGIYGAKAVFYDEKIIVNGGNGNKYDFITSISGENWNYEHLFDIPARSYHVFLVFNNHLWIMGGSYSENMGLALRNDVWRTTGD